MKLEIEKKVDQLAVRMLAVALEKETFSEACCIGELNDQEVYVKCPNSLHGVIVNTKQLSSEVVSWVIQCLKDSLRPLSQNNSQVHPC